MTENEMGLIQTTEIPEANVVSKRNYNYKFLAQIREMVTQTADTDFDVEAEYKQRYSMKDLEIETPLLVGDELTKLNKVFEMSNDEINQFLAAEEFPNLNPENISISGYRNKKAVLAYLKNEYIDKKTWEIYEQCVAENPNIEAVLSKKKKRKHLCV